MFSTLRSEFWSWVNRSTDDALILVRELLQVQDAQRILDEFLKETPELEKTEPVDNCLNWSSSHGSGTSLTTDVSVQQVPTLEQMLDSAETLQRTVTGLCMDYPKLVMHLNARLHHIRKSLLAFKAAYGRIAKVLFGLAVLTSICSVWILFLDVPGIVLTLQAVAVETIAISFCKEVITGMKAIAAFRAPSWALIFGGRLEYPAWNPYF